MMEEFKKGFGASFGSIVGMAAAVMFIGAVAGVFKKEEPKQEDTKQEETNH